ncbi:polymer-forming cytoskeletal protein [Halorarum halophilum]|uniref:Polymer-forming cytoskeletal protein n=1 Tax=Halorarum halophilum TaxID=2743090 RepID=A0A7D5GGK8_9EURY|nr:polymer-forming cytoskeletal protein [Halobaculum halophilum]QLG28490.1 polymer-forming cytoskeletal protein [Halobaculum halophilum]
MSSRAARVVPVVVLCAVLAVGPVVGGTAATQPGDGVPSGPFTTVAVAPGETVEGRVTATGGRVVVAGTVEGNLRAYGAVVVLTGDAVVTGDVQAFGGRVVVDGEVSGPVTAYGGTVAVAGTTGDLNAGGGTVRLSGTTGDATVLGGTAVLADGATVDGDFEYDARLDDRGGAVAGERLATDSLLGPVGAVLRLAGWLPVVLTLLGGALGFALARADPRTDVLTRRVREAPVRAVARGTGVALASLVGVLLVAATVVGLPLLGLLAPLLLAGALVLLALGSRVVGGVVADYLPVSADAAGLAVAVSAAALATVPVVGPAAPLLLALPGAGAAAPSARSLRIRSLLSVRGSRE